MSKDSHFLLVAGYLALCAAVIKTRENFEVILTDSALESVLDIDRNVCVPFKQLGRNAPFIIKEMRLKNVDYDDSTACYINMKDTLFDGNATCSRDNPRIYNRRFDNIIEDISKGYDLDDDQTKMTSTEVCKIKFRPETMNSSYTSQLMNYAKYLDDNDPLAANCRRQIEQLNENNQQLRTNITSLTNDLTNRTNELQNASSRANTCESRLSVANSTINNLSRDTNNLQSRIDSINSQLVAANQRANFVAVQANPIVAVYNPPDVIGWATQNGTVGRGVTTNQLWFAYKGRIHANFRIIGRINGVRTNPAPLTLTVINSSYKGPDILVAFGRPFTGDVILQRMNPGASSTWKDVNVRYISNKTSIMYYGADQTGDSR